MHRNVIFAFGLTAAAILMLAASIPGLPHARDVRSPDAAPGTDDSAAETIFQQRIMPIFRSDDPSSCVQCHLASVDLKDYILPSHERRLSRCATRD